MIPKLGIGIATSIFELPLSAFRKRALQMSNNNQQNRNNMQLTYIKKITNDTNKQKSTGKETSKQNNQKHPLNTISKIQKPLLTDT